ncbi:MAG TPA: NAD(P)/FAD-dependent oxidoreductase, partial [Ilumatobacteraceae bacterium]|nr:NAD(P)/FAD-dependent oxidoreductase [Ilumatobacteraceae bacterium]
TTGNHIDSTPAARHEWRCGERRYCLHGQQHADGTEENRMSQTTEHFDVLIAGAGISGIGAAYHLQTQVPGKSFVVLEKFGGFGGTWRVHTYPGVRSDSDLYTFGYRFKPWNGAPIAAADKILDYLHEVIDDNDLARHIRYDHEITDASWDSGTNRWTLQVTQTDPDSGEQTRRTFTANFLWMCQGYYRHEQGYTPDWPGFSSYQGQVIHPQTWPDDVDLSGKKVVVIGSGATAATLIPAIAGQCDGVTMLQRSPTYFVSRPNVNELADTLRSLDIPEEWTHEIVRRKNLQDGAAITQLSFEAPELMRDELLRLVQAELPEGFDMRHFTPAYRPWQQRLALVPDGDMFAAIREGKASVVTDEIETFNETGILTKGGVQLDADVVITATGFDLSVLGGIPFSVDGQPVSWPDTVTYRGTMVTGVPNMAWVFGYFRSSWTLRVDLIGDFVCRLLQHMDELGASRVTPALRTEDAEMTISGWIDPDNFNPGYMMRSMHLLPKRGDKPEWQHTQDYEAERVALPAADLDDGCLVFE